MCILGVGSVLGLAIAPLLLHGKAFHLEEQKVQGLRLIVPNLWQGGLGDDVFSFDDYDLDIVYDLRTDIERPKQSVEVPINKRYVRMPMVDRQIDDPEELRLIAEYIAACLGRKKVGVFCNMGINRSGLVCALVAQAVSRNADEARLEADSRIFNPDFAKHLSSEERTMMTHRNRFHNRRVVAHGEQLQEVFADANEALERGKKYLKSVGR